MKVSCGGSAMWRELRMIGLLIVYVGECAGSCSLGRPQERCIDTMKELFKENRFECQASKENGAG